MLRRTKVLIAFFAKRFAWNLRIWNIFKTDIGTIRKMLTLIIVNCVVYLENVCLLFKANFVSFAFHEINEFCIIYKTYWYPQESMYKNDHILNISIKNWNFNDNDSLFYFRYDKRVCHLDNKSLSSSSGTIAFYQNHFNTYIKICSTINEEKVW